MQTAGWVVLALLLGILLSTWVTFTLTRLDRLHAKVDAANAALDAQLVRRAAALLFLAETAVPPIPVEFAAELERVAKAALVDSYLQRQAAENKVGKCLAELAPWRSELPAAPCAELAEAATRVVIARRFYNDSVRDTRTLRARRMPRMLHLAGRRELPAYFDIDDTALFGEPITLSTTNTISTMNIIGTTSTTTSTSTSSSSSSSSSSSPVSAAEPPP